MRPTPCISVVVPFFNSERTLGDCIESLLGQRSVGGPYEILLIDNGSPDGSRAIAEGYADQANVQLLDEAAPGAYAARNTGIRQASAPLIALTDADCVVDADWLQCIRQTMQDPTIGALLGHCRYPDDASWRLHLLGAYENAKTRYVVERCAPRHHFAYANNMALRASLFEELGPFKTWPRAADSEWVHRLAGRRPDLRLAYRATMGICHLEFVKGRQRAQRLKLYQTTNSQIATFRELSFRQRLTVLGRWAVGLG